MTTVSTDRPHGLNLTPAEDSMLAFGVAMQKWEASLKRPDMQERDRVAGALLAYQSQLDALVITRHGRKP